MTSDKGIYIQNIYYMLSYAFHVLRQDNYAEVAGEDFQEVSDLFAAILAKGVAQQLKQGLYREYITMHDTLPVLRGKLDLPQAVRVRIRRERKLACEYDELSENNLYNQILKTTMHYLLRDSSVQAERKAELGRVLVFFSQVSLLEPSEIQWSRLYFQRSNRNYEMLLNICYFILGDMLQTTEDGSYRMRAFSDENMARLYEKFILEYYRRHHSYLSQVAAAQIQWNLTGENDESMIRFLPAMKSDIYLRLGRTVLIIDAKYYGSTLQHYYDRDSLHSKNLYQIFTYVKNEDRDGSGNVSGLLLYAKTEEDITPDCMFEIGGNRIGAKTLDLNTDFHRIAEQLDQIAEMFFGHSPKTDARSFSG